MAHRMLLERASDLEGLGRATREAGIHPFAPLWLDHLYIKLDFLPQFENARTAEDARAFLRSVARAAVGAQQVASVLGGKILEVQGSTLHIGLPAPTQSVSAHGSLNFASALHQVYETVFHDPRSRVQGWRMTVDSGKTLVVAGRGVHGDDSWVSLGTAANRPAKHLYAELELPEDRRSLKRFHVGVRNATDGRWYHYNLDQEPTGLEGIVRLGESARDTEIRLDYSMGMGQIMADAAPIAPQGSPHSPTVERPETFFGWVLRTDLDGFTARVEQCLDSNDDLQELAGSFYEIMNRAAEFTEQGTGEILVQLPWAGDNFTVAAVFRTRAEYERALPTRLVELSLDFEKELSDIAAQGQFAGWAHGVAGGVPHGNAGGNVYLGGVEIDGRRFLVGAGEGFGRSTQAFGDIDPSAEEIVIYRSDWERLSDDYREDFSVATTRRGQDSTLYRNARLPDLLRRRARRTSTAAEVVVTTPYARSETIRTRPYSA